MKEREKEEKQLTQLVAQNCPKAGDNREFVLKLLLSHGQISLSCSLILYVLVLLSSLIYVIVLR